MGRAIQGRLRQQDSEPVIVICGWVLLHECPVCYSYKNNNTAGAACYSRAKAEMKARFLRLATLKASILLSTRSSTAACWHCQGGMPDNGMLVSMLSKFIMVS